MSRFTDLFQEPTQEPESIPESEPIPEPEPAKVEKTKVPKTIRTAKRKFTLD